MPPPALVFDVNWANGLHADSAPLFWFSQVIDFYRFEETFRLGHPSISEDDVEGTPKSHRRSKRPETISLLETNRLRNVGQ